MAIDFKTILESLLPKGAAWLAKSGSGLDNLLEGVGSSFSSLRDDLETLSNIRDPDNTPILADLEHEYGVIPDVGLTEAERRETLRGIVFAKPGMGVDHMTAELHNAGFTNLFAYQNDPLTNPEFYTDGTWSAWCGGQDSFCGGEDAYCGYESGGGGYILINDNAADATTDVPNDPTIWHLVFFVGGTKTAATAGYFVLVDGDMEAATTAAWTSGPGSDTTLTKETTTVYEGTQSLKVELTDHSTVADPESFYGYQDLGVDALDQDLKSAPLTHDDGAAVLYDTGFKWSDKSRLNGENGDAGDAIGFGVRAGGSNASDKLAIDFLDAQMAHFDGAVSDEGSWSCWAKVNDASRTPTFDADYSSATGCGDLPNSLTINSVTKAPTFRYDAPNADLTSWDATVGDDLPVVSAGADPTFDYLAPGPNDSRVKFNAGDYYRAASGSFADIGTDDFVIELVGSIEDGSTGLLSKSNGASDRMMLFGNGSANALYLYLDAAIVAANNISLDGTWQHLIAFVDRSGSAVWYINGVQQTPTAISSLAARTLGSGSLLNLGSRNGSNITSSSLTCISMWQGAGWLDTHLQADIAQERASIAMGMYPQIAQTIGGSTDGYLPKTVGRSTPALLEKVLPGDTETALIYVGVNWMRVDRAFDVDLSPIQGYHPQPVSTNRLIYSEDLTDVAWTKNAVAITSNAITELGEQDFDAIVADGTDVFHNVEQSATITTGVHTASVYVKAGDKDVIKLETTGTAAACYFDLDDATTTESGAADGSRVEIKGGGIFRLSFAYNATSTGETIKCGPVVSDVDDDFAGDSVTVNCYVFGLQLEKSSTDDTYLPSSYTKTVAASVSRTADILTMHAAENVGGAAFDVAAIRAEFMGVLDPSGNGWEGHLVNIGDGSAANGIQILSNIAEISAKVEAASVNQALLNGLQSTYTGEKQTYECGAKLDDFRLYQERVELDDDTSGSMPTGSVDLDIGQRYDSTLQFNGIIPRITISPYGLANPRGIMGCIETVSDKGQFLAYDDKFDSTFEIRGSADIDGLVQFNMEPTAGGMVESTWYHLALTWDYVGGNVVVQGYIDGIELGYYAGASGDPTIGGKAPMLLAIAALKNAAAGGDVTIAAPKSFSEKVHEDWIQEEFARGVPEENDSSLISEYSSRAETGDTVHDMVAGDDFTISGTPAETLSRGVTEGGHALRFGAGVTGVADMGATTHPFLLAQDHTFEAWLRIEGSADQVIWTNQGAAGFIQELVYDSATDALIYTCIVGATSRSVTTAIDSSRLTHVAITREFAGGNTTQALYLDGVLKATTSNAGAPVVSATYDDLTVGSDGSGDYFYGMLQGVRLYDSALDVATILALHDVGQTAIELGSYATQTITPTTEITPVTGWAYGEDTNAGDGVADEDYEYAYPVVLYKRTVDDNWRAIFVGSNEGNVPQSWQDVDELADSVYAIRYQIKNPCNTRSSGYAGDVGAGFFDLLAGGEESPTSIIQSVDIPEAKRQILEKIVMRNKPLHTWAGMVVRYV